MLKIFNVSVTDHIPTLEQSSRSDVISRALCYMPDEIDVFANAWSSTHAFDKLDVAIREAIEYCAENVSFSLTYFTSTAKLILIATFSKTRT